MKVSFYGQKTFRPISVFIVALLWVLLIAPAPALRAQNETGVRRHNKAKVQLSKGWYDSTTAMYQHQYPIIRSIPPIASTMPFDVLLSYVYLDSLLRFKTNDELDATLAGWQSMNDTLKWAAAMYYRLTDYNPIIFRQYDVETQINRRKNPLRKTSKAVGITIPDTVPNVGRYSASVSHIDQLAGVAARLYPVAADRKAFYAMLAPDYVMRVKILAIDSMVDTYLMVPPNVAPEYAFNVTAEVLDTIKGKTLDWIHCDEYAVKASSVENPPRNVQSCRIIHFLFRNRNYENIDQAIGENYEPAFLNSEGRFSMKVGQEAVVFLSLSDVKVDFEHDYFHLCLNRECSYNALPIIEGNVHDINEVWGNGKVYPYATWLTKAASIISSIITRNY